MALASSYRDGPIDEPDVPEEPQLSGIFLVVVPSTQLNLRTDLQRTSQTGGAVASSSGWTSIVDLMPSQSAGAPYFDQLPATTERWFYRARHTGSIYNQPSAWTAETTGHGALTWTKDNFPTIKEQQSWPFPKPWLPVSSGVITKTLTIPPAFFYPATTNDAFSISAGQLVNATTGRVNLRSGLFLPLNATPSAVRWTAYQSSGTTGIGQANQFLFTVATYPSSSGDYTVPRTFGIALGGGYGMLSSSGWTDGTGSVTIAYAALSSETYVIEATLGCTSFASGAMMNRIEIDYTVADYYSNI